MNKLFVNLILTVILAFAGAKADAVVLKDVQVMSEIQKATEKLYKKSIADEVSVKVVGVPFAELNVPAGKITYNIQRNSTNYVPRELVKVSLLVNGKTYKVFNAPITTKVYANVLVATTTIDRNQAITPFVVATEKKDVSNIYSHVLKPVALVNHEYYSKKYFVSGEIIDERFVKLKPEVLRNSLVTVFFNSNNLTISVDGVALSDGAIGEHITVLNKKYNRVYKGTVVGENKILVKI